MLGAMGFHSAFRHSQILSVHNLRLCRWRRAIEGDVASLITMNTRFVRGTLVGVSNALFHVIMLHQM